MIDSAIRLQPIPAGSAGLLRSVAIRSYSDHYLHLWHDGGAWYIDKCFTIDNLEKELTDPNALFFLVNYHDEPVGFMKINMNMPLGNYPPEEALELERIYLMQKASDKGIGTHLLQHVFDLAREGKKKLVWLKVMDSSREAINFYKKNGFEICGTGHLEFPQMKEEFRGMFIMKKNLSGD